MKKILIVSILVLAMFLIPFANTGKATMPATSVTWTPGQTWAYAWKNNFSDAISNYYHNLKDQGNVTSASLTYTAGYSMMYYVKYIGQSGNLYQFYYKGGMLKYVTMNIDVSNSTMNATVNEYLNFNLNFNGYFYMTYENGSGTGFNGYAIVNQTINAQGYLISNVNVYEQYIKNGTAIGSYDYNLTSSFTLNLNVSYSNPIPFISFANRSQVVITSGTATFSGMITGHLYRSITGINKGSSGGFNIDNNIDSSFSNTVPYMVQFSDRVVGGGLIETHPALLEKGYTVLPLMLSTYSMGQMSVYEMPFLDVSAVSTYNGHGFYDSNTIGISPSESNVDAVSTTGSSNVTSQPSTESDVNSYLSNKMAYTPTSGTTVPSASVVLGPSILLYIIAVVVVIIVILTTILVYRRKNKPAQNVQQQMVNGQGQQFQMSQQPLQPQQGMPYQQAAPGQAYASQPVSQAQNMQNSTGNAITAVCPYCGSINTYPADYRGRTVKCNSCGSTLQL